jgi:hypothetical protein
MADTIDALQGVYDAATGTVIGFLPVQPYGRRVTSIVIQGPSRSTFKMYRGDRATATNQISATPTGGGGDNTYDSTTDGAPVSIGPSEQVIGVWSGGATTVGSRGTATVRSVY